ncbi:MAG TPA: hypothetical protein PK605_00270 [Ignavibacteria bacterium]|nr:hypothetical protein [Bacteroidota bacterium]HRE10785.1 hypothetical protein [Ignavibacteria bacterium]HRF65972.1 hypothetical protein [Ignavibacteria bacterium]HRJ02813.1 hypothetical protein [Ignavibacteria bacterium]HRJ84371.1 hypothetical protein [Ignavibacteria bacterium]
MADTMNGSDGYKIQIPLGKGLSGDTYCPVVKEHSFYLERRPWLLTNVSKTIERTEITPGLTTENFIRTNTNNRIHFRIGEQ